MMRASLFQLCQDGNRLADKIEADLAELKRKCALAVDLLEDIRQLNRATKELYELSTQGRNVSSKEISIKSAWMKMIQQAQEGAYADVDNAQSAQDHKHGSELSDDPDDRESKAGPKRKRPSVTKEGTIKKTEVRLR